MAKRIILRTEQRTVGKRSPDAEKFMLLNKFLSYQKSWTSTVPFYSDYSAHCLWEKQIHRQVNFIDGKHKGFRMMFLSQDATKEYLSQLYSIDPSQQGVDISIPNTTTKRRDFGTKTRQFRCKKSKTESEIFSGKGAATSEGSHSPQSVEKKKKMQLLMNSRAPTPYFRQFGDSRDRHHIKIFSIRRGKQNWDD